MDVTIRSVRPDDTERVRELHVVALEDAGTDPDALPDLSDLDDVAGHYRPEGEFLVGEIDGEVVAMGGLEAASDATAELRRMRVDPAHQGRGYGRAILRALEAVARERGFARIVVTTAARQDSAPFYRTHGYEETGREEWEGYELIHLETVIDSAAER